MDDTRSRVMKAEILLNRYKAIWTSDLTTRQKVRFLNSHVLPSLLYATECGNHTQLEIDQLAVFLKNVDGESSM